MRRTGRGKIFAFPTNWRWDGNVLFADADVLLYNFDVDGSDLKEQHKDFLYKQLVVHFGINTEARVTIVGQASLSGESNHNDVLSENRAKGVRDYFVSKGVAPNQFMPKPAEVIALGDAPSGPAKEDERDRSITLRLSFPLNPRCESATESACAPVRRRASRAP
jgi:OmpA family